MNKYRVAFFGTPQIAKGVLETLLTMESVEVVFVISQPDKLVGRKQEVVFSPVKQLCVYQSLTCYQPVKVNEIFNELQQANLDFLVTCAYGQFIPTKVLNLAKIAPLNLHGSILPKYRGGAPIQYAVLNGDQQTGISLMKMVAKMDAGPVYSTTTLNVEPNETSGTLFNKMEQLAKQVIERDLVKIATGELQPVDQDESQVSFAYNITSEQEKIDWNKTNFQIDQLIRALSPTPVSHTFLAGERYKVGNVQVIEKSEAIKKAEPGTILEFDQLGIIVQTGSGLLRILTLQRPGKKMLPTNNYLATNGVGLVQLGAKFD